MRAERELMRGAGPVAVLKLLQIRDMYGYELIQALARQSGGVLAMGHSTLYPMLYNLEAKGWIESFTRTAPSGRQRKYYRLSERGRRKLAEQTERWQALVRAMQALGIVPEPTPSVEGMS